MILHYTMSITFMCDLCGSSTTETADVKRGEGLNSARDKLISRGWKIYPQGSHEDVILCPSCDIHKKRILEMFK